MTTATAESTITAHEAAQIDRANATSATPVVFVHGLWLLPSSWDRWLTLFEEAGYVGVTPGWPDDPETVAEARAHPEVLAGKGIGEIADYEEAIIRRLDRKPVIIGHSFGGLLTMILAGRGLAALAGGAVVGGPARRHAHHVSVPALCGRRRADREALTSPFLTPDVAPGGWLRRAARRTARCRAAAAGNAGAGSSFCR